VILMAVWPILDQERTRRELISEALFLLPEVAEQTHCTVVGMPAWDVMPGFDLPGWGSVDLVLVCTIGAEQLPGNRRPRSPTDNIALIRRLAMDGKTDREIADVIGCSESGVAKARRRAQPPIAAGVGNPTLEAA
jgi:hypothetical protein